MAHARQQIREAIVTAVTGLTTTGSRVYESRVYPHDQVPCLSIYTLRDTVQEAVGAMLGRRLRRELEVAVEARAKPAEGAATMDDQLDTICAEVETALAGSVTLGGRVIYLEITSTEITLSGDLERPSGIAQMIYRMVYMVSATDPTTILTY